jgi:hypothetical protein
MGKSLLGGSGNSELANVPAQVYTPFHLLGSPGRKAMDRKELMELFNHRPRNSLLVTSNRKGEVNAAVYGTPRMIDENTIVLASRDSRTYRYLQENPLAAVIVMEPGEVGRNSRGVRVYLELIAIETEGELLRTFKQDVAGRAGKESAAALHAAMRFRILEVRPLVGHAPPS